MEEEGQSVRRFMLPTHEPLSHVLRRLGAAACAEKTPAANAMPAPASEKARAGPKEYAMAQQITISKAVERLFKTVIVKAKHQRTASAVLIGVDGDGGWHHHGDVLVIPGNMLGVYLLIP